MSEFQRFDAEDDETVPGLPKGNSALKKLVADQACYKVILQETTEGHIQAAVAAPSRS